MYLTWSLNFTALHTKEIPLKYSWSLLGQNEVVQNKSLAMNMTICLFCIYFFLLQKWNKLAINLWIWFDFFSTDNENSLECIAELILYVHVHVTLILFSYFLYILKSI